MTIKPDMPNTTSRHASRRPPLCYSRPRAAVAADHNDSRAVLTTLTVVTAAVVWLMVYSGISF